MLRVCKANGTGQEEKARKRFLILEKPLLSLWSPKASGHPLALSPREPCSSESTILTTQGYSEHTSTCWLGSEHTSTCVSQRTVSTTLVLNANL